MSDELETVADIRKEAETKFRELVEAWMQRRTTFRTTLGAMQSFNMMFDRLEAAHEREVKAYQIDVNTMELYKLAQAMACVTTPDQVADIIPPKDGWLEWTRAMREIAREALAAPPRNCDRFGGDNAKLQKVYYSECGKEYEPQDPNSRQAYLVGYGNWLLALAQKGGAK